MYITINNIIGEKTIDLSYPIRSSKEIAVINMLTDNVQYEIIKPHSIIDSISPGNEKLILSKTYAGRELLSVLGGLVAFYHFVNDDRVIKTNKLRGITEMILNLNELDNTDNLEDGRPSTFLHRHHATGSDEFKQLVAFAPQYKKLKNREFTSLTLGIMDRNGNIRTDGPQVTVVLHIRDCKL